MRRILLTTASLVAIMSAEIEAQYLSPEVHADRTVTFRLRAPNAKQVSVTGLHGQRDLKMEQDDRGMWEVTTEPLAAELYSYTFVVDGTPQLDPSNRDVKKWLTCASQVEVPGDPPRLHERTAVPHGVVHHHWYDSTAAEKQRGVFVYTPPGYSEADDRDLPVVFLLHGYGDDQSAWLEVGRANFIVDNLIARNVVEPCVVVMPYGHPLTLDLDQPFDSYADKNRDWMERDVVGDLMPFIENHYRVTTDRSRRAIVGLSMGGGQSLAIGLRHLDKFAIVGGFSSACPQGDSDDIAAQLERLSADVDAANDQIDLLWLGCGREDFLLQRNERFVDWLNEKGVKHEYELTDGGHDWIVWRKYLVTFLEKGFGK